MPRATFLLTLLLSAACQTQPSPDPQPTPSGEWEREQRLQSVEQHLHALTPWLARIGDTASPLAVEPAALTELNARLAALTEALDGVADKGPVEASAAKLTAPAANAAGIDVLRRALEVEQQRRELVLVNLANVHTCGWKKLVLVTDTQRDAATGLPFPVVRRRVPLLTSGTLEITERNLDVAIDGDGFFVGRRADGSLGYTRNSNLQVNADGKLVTTGGAVVQPDITLPIDALEIAIDPVGRVQGRTASDPDHCVDLGRIRLVRFTDPAVLEPGRDGLWAAPAERTMTGQPGDVGFGLLKQRFCERSNVQVLNELIDLQLVERQIVVLHRALASHGIFVR